MKIRDKFHTHCAIKAHIKCTGMRLAACNDRNYVSIDILRDQLFDLY